MAGDRLEPLRRIARRIPGGMALGRRLHRALDPELRAMFRLRRTRADAVFQPVAYTRDERYPALFDAVAVRLAAIPAPRILCFGCASGAEVRALRVRLPHARMTGVDINPRAIAQAVQADPLSRYVCADRPEAGARYDAILALAVFRHTDLEAHRPDVCTAVLPFRRFADGAAMLDSSLEPGGWLAICHAHFRFDDTAAARGYADDEFRMTDETAGGLLYGPDDGRLDDTAWDKVLFRKPG
jgi:Methyltransferase domain